MSNELLELYRIRKEYGKTVAVNDLSITVSEGEFLAIMGPSGCGKSTTLKLLAGLEAPDAGEVRYFGKRVNELPSWQREIPLVWQNLALFPFLNVRENVEFGLKMRGISKTVRSDKANFWLQRLGIDECSERNINTLSGGQKQRVALARCLVINPKILLLDEPLSALDPKLRISMQTLLTSLQRELGITFIYVTHSQDEAFAMADRVIIMKEGAIQQNSTPQKIFNNPENAFVAEFIGSFNLIKGTVKSSASGNIIASTNIGDLCIPETRNDPHPIGSKVLAAIKVHGCQIFENFDNAKENNQARGIIVGEEFIGSTSVLHVGLSEETIFKVEYTLSDAGSTRVRVGDQVVISWKMEESQLVPFNEEIMEVANE